MANQYTTTGGRFITPHPIYLCYAESENGSHWRKPELGLIEFKGSKKNNIMWADNQTDYEVPSGTAVIISIVASGDDLTYQWYRGKSGDMANPIAGTTSSTLKTDALTEGSKFWVQIKTKAGVNIHSDTSEITVIDPSNHQVHDATGNISGENTPSFDGNVFGPIFLNTVDAGHSAVFKDTNPEAPPDARYKAIRVSGDFEGLMVFKSADGIQLVSNE